MILPDFLVVGAEKSGTTALYTYFAEHPEIFVSPEVKESHFLLGFDRATEPELFKLMPYIVTDLDEYAKLFRTASSMQRVGEVDPSCLRYPERSIPRIKRYLGDDVQIIISLRNPIERFYSLYLNVLSTGREWLSLEQLLAVAEHQQPNSPWRFEHLDSGRYYLRVKAFIEGFDQLLVLLYDDFKADANGFLRRIFRFLDVDEEYSPDMSVRVYPSGVARSMFLHKLLLRPGRLKSGAKSFLPKRALDRIKWRLIGANLNPKPPMSEQARDHLTQYYRSDILKLEELLQKDLSAWLEASV